ncbi:hypothetical protein CU098_005143, partial [Rhizopus stolonifer]
VIWEFGLCAATSYVFGLANTASNTSDITKRVIFFSRNQIDIVFNVLSTVPFTFNFICSILAIIHAQNNDYSRAKIFTILIYSTWTIYCIVMAIITAYFGISSLKVFKIHLKNQLGVSNPSVSNIKSSIMRMKVIASVLTCNYMAYAGVATTYTVGRDKMMVNTTFNIIECFICHFFATASCTFILTALIF